MFGLGHWEILIIPVIVLIIFGAGKLPEIGAGIGNAIRNFNEGVTEMKSEIKEEPEKIETS